MNIKAIKIIVSELNYFEIKNDPEAIFEISFDKSSDLIIDWRNRKVKALIKNLAQELLLNYREDFKIGHTLAENLPEKVNSLEKIKAYLNKTLEEYIEIAEIFIK